jgi:hypothetical protein
MQEQKQKYTVFGEVYNVAKDEKEHFGKSLTNDQSWYEYRVYLQDNSGKIVDMWDSKVETYNGVKGQRLSKQGAKDAINEIKEDINEKGENPELWFSNID